MNRWSEHHEVTATRWAVRDAAIAAGLSPEEAEALSQSACLDRDVAVSWAAYGSERWATAWAPHARVGGLIVRDGRLVVHDGRDGWREPSLAELREELSAARGRQAEARVVEARIAGATRSRVA